jgi:hypothetical protein
MQSLRRQAPLRDGGEQGGGVGMRVNSPGHEALWQWFGLSYAAWLTLPRVLMHEMPDDWQARMAALLEEFNDTWTEAPEGCGIPTVTNLDSGRFKRWPAWLLNYRYPDSKMIAAIRTKR